ncbi:MAG: CPBP family glutamic-type intramembrane protease [Verrucomicrobiota bacterium]
MRPVRLLFIYLVVVFAGGALLAPWLWLATQWAAGHWPAFGPLARHPFSSFVVRSMLGLALLGLWPLLRDCQMLSRRELGFAGAGRPLRNIAAGFAIGFGSFAAAAALALLSAALFGILRKCFAFPVALVCSSAIYASVHFLQKAAAPDHIGWLSGLAMLPPMLRGPPDGLPLVPTFFTLLVVGAILALAYQRTGTLFMSIGLHAGWVFWVKSYGFLTRQTSGGARAIWGGDRLVDGWVPLLILAGLLVLMLRSRRLASNSNPSAR